jgi:hypothetical protein
MADVLEKALALENANRGVLDSDTAEKHSLRIMEQEWNNQGGREYWDKIKNSPPLVPHVKALVEKVMN